MTYENNSELRGLVRAGMGHAPARQKELLEAKSFVLADVDYEAAVAEVKAQHSAHSDAEAEARAAYRLLTRTKAPDAPVVVRHSIFSKWFWSRQRVWACLRVAWAIAILAMLVLLAALSAHGQQRAEEGSFAPMESGLRMTSYRTKLGRGYPAAAPDVPGGVIIQVSNQGTLLATRPAGLLKFDCQSGMSCSFSGVTFALTSTGAGGGVNVQVNAGPNLASPVNFQNGSAVTGVAINFSNPSGSNVQAAISGTLTDAGLLSAYSGVGSCTNQVMTSLARNAAPGCASVSGAMFANQNANLLFAGPSSGSAAAPAFRASVPADLNLAVNSQTGAGYTIASADQCKLVTFSNAAGQTVNLPGTVPAAGWCVFFQNTGAGAVTFSPNGNNLDGAAASLNLDVHDGLMIVSDGANYFSMGGAGRRATVTAGTTDCLSNFTTAGCTNIGTAETVFATSYSVKNGAMFTNRALRAQWCLVETTPATVTNITFQVRWGGIGGTILVTTGSIAPGTSLANRGACMTYVIYGMAAVGASANVGLYQESPGGLAGTGQLNTTQMPQAVTTNADETLVLTLTYANTTNNEKVTVEGAKFWWDN